MDKEKLAEKLFHDPEFMLALFDVFRRNEETGAPESESVDLVEDPDERVFRFSLLCALTMGMKIGMGQFSLDYATPEILCRAAAEYGMMMEEQVQRHADPQEALRFVSECMDAYFEERKLDVTSGVKEANEP